MNGHPILGFIVLLIIMGLIWAQTRRLIFLEWRVKALEEKSKKAIGEGENE